MTPVSPWFATAKLLNEIGLVRTRTEQSRSDRVQQESTSREAAIRRS